MDASGAAGGRQSLKRSELATVAARHEHHDEIDNALSEWTSSFEKQDLAERLQQFRIAAAPVQKSRDPLFDPHLAERGLFRMVEHERPILGYAAHPHPTTPWFASGHERHQLRDLHFHGADNFPVLESWLGMSEEEVRALEASGALIVLRNVVVEDRRTAFRDADHAERLGLPGGTQ
jgi:crotonobetainyl-CoA:carnitine CoA-transferase CaiB-like acyl-CoA transferase